MTATIDARTDRSLVITRLFDAPRSLVFKAWTEPEHLVHWFGPKDFEATSLKFDVRKGGAYRCTIRSPGEDHTMIGIYTEVKPPERLAFTFAWEGEDGKPGHPMHIEIDFAEEAGRTRMTFRHVGFETAKSRDDHNGGWTSCFDRLQDYVAAQ